MELGERGLFRGHAVQAIDGKGRVAIPASMRAVVERNSGERILLIARHEVAPCLIGYDRNWSDRLHERIARDEERAFQSGQPFDRAAVSRRAFGLVEEVPFDASGRFILPPFLRHKAKLQNFAVFYATGDVFEIWDPQVLCDDPMIDDDTRESVQFLLSQRGEA